RRLRTRPARAALEWARHAAHIAGIPGLIAEVESASQALETPAARLITQGRELPVLLEEVEALQGSPALIVDAFRYALRGGGVTISLASRPVLFALART
ncbi:MAG: helix-turn-helix domain-containing protein, partial [Mesorhizobium sp.]